MGPYQIHYGSDGESDILLVAKGNRNLYSIEGTNRWTVLYNGLGLGFVDCSDPTAGSFNHISVTLQNSKGEDLAAYIRTNTTAGGSWNVMLEYTNGQGIVGGYLWKDGHWARPRDTDTANKALQSEGASAPRPER
jgi:hypothetical protein